MQIPILNGIYTNEESDFRTSYPKNMIPVPKPQGISAGYLKPSEGIVQNGTGPGETRGGINWDDECYRVLGSDLAKIAEDGTVNVIGSVGSGDRVAMDYSFDYLGVVSGGGFYLYDGATLQEVVDEDLGNVIDLIWVDGFFMLTDGEFLIVTNLNDPFTIDPTKYGSSEVDPDPVKALIKLRNEPHALNRYTIEVFDNIGGSNFPFQRVDGAQIMRGTVGTHACCKFLEAIAFVGGGRNESIAVWLGASGSSVKISTREIDQILCKYTEEQLSKILVEAKVDIGHQFLYIHLPDRTLVYDGAGSQIVGEPVWFILSSSISGLSQYRARDLVWCYGQWLVADPTSDKIGYLTDSTSEHWGLEIEWEITTSIIYNEGNGAIFHELELIGLPGRGKVGEKPTVYTRYSLDGETWSMYKSISSGNKGNRTKRLVWFNQGAMRNYRLQRFRGTSESRLAIARFEARIEQLMV